MNKNSINQGKLLFQIPVYAFTEKELQKRIEHKRQKLTDVCGNLDSHIPDIVLSEEIRQFSDYHSHIVGFIEIEITQSDILIKRYIPCTEKKYRWNSRKKICLMMHPTIERHFRIVGLNNKEIVNKIDSQLDSLIKEKYASRYYVDTRIYGALKNMVDYRSFID